MSSHVRLGLSMNGTLPLSHGRSLSSSRTSGNGRRLPKDKVKFIQFAVSPAEVSMLIAILHAGTRASTGTILHAGIFPVHWVP